MGVKKMKGTMPWGGASRMGASGNKRVGVCVLVGGGYRAGGQRHVD
jgi:hypothetical protein